MTKGKIGQRVTKGKLGGTRDAAEDPHRTGQLALFGALLCMLASPSAQRPAADFEASFAPRRYVAYRAPSALTLDGKLNEPAWTAAAWSSCSSTSRATARRATASARG